MANSDNAVDQALSDLQSQWYNAVAAGLGAPQQTFQLLQPSIPLGDTSDELWSYFNDLPPQAAVAQFVPGGGNRFYDDYRAVVAQLVVQNDGSFRRDLGDKYGAWLDYVGKLSPLPSIEDLPGVFRSWAAIFAPDAAQAGANDLAALLNDPIFIAQTLAANQSSFVNGIPNFSRTIRDLRDAIASAEARHVTMDSESESNDITHTWAKGHAVGFFNLFNGFGHGEVDALTAKFASSRVHIDASFSNVMTFAAEPGDWYNNGALAAAFATPDNTVWKHGTPNWDSTFGDSGTMRWFVTSLVVVDGIDVTISSGASFASEERETLKTSSSFGFWPFFGLGHSQDYRHEASFDAQGSATVNISSPRGNPVVFGANVVPASAFITGSAAAPRAAAKAPLPRAIAWSSVGAGTHASQAGRARGYVVRIRKQQWNHPVYYVVRDDVTGANLAAGRVGPGTTYSPDIVVPANHQFTVLNVGNWPLDFGYPT
jgi:hypothetical protein